MSIHSDKIQLGLQHHTAGDFKQAEIIYREVLEADPENADAMHFLGVIAYQMGRPDLSIELIEKAVTLKPTASSFYINLGNSYRNFAQQKKAEECYRKALHLKPDAFDAYNNLAVLLGEMGQPKEAIECYQKAIAYKPDYADAYYNLGVSLNMQGDLNEAVESLRQAIKANPQLVGAYKDLGVTLIMLGDFQAGLECYHEALRIAPSDGLRVKIATSVPILINSYQQSLKIRQELTNNIRQLLNEKLTIENPYKEVGQLPFYAAYHGLNDLQILKQLSSLYRHACPSLQAIAPHCLSLPQAPQNRKIRIGFISNFFKTKHIIWLAMSGLILNLSRDQFSVVLFSVDRLEDDLCKTLHTDDRVVYIPENLQAAREKITAEELDILYYTDIGMDPFTYCLAHSKLAHIQCTGWGHPVTSGISTIDYYLSSDSDEIEHAQLHYNENLVRLKKRPVYYHRSKLAGPLKTRKDFNLDPSHNLYLCPATPFKFHPDFDEVLAGILRADPQGRLILVEYRQMHSFKLLMDRWRERMPDVVDRIIFVPRQELNDFLNLMAVCDVLLDTFYFNGGTTVLEAFAVGVPVVTMPNDYLRGRFTCSYYKQMGMMECVASNKKEYVNIALRLGTDKSYRERISREINEKSCVLYEDAEAIREVEQFFITAMKAKTGVAGEKSNVNKELEEGLKLHQRGELPQAEAVYRRVLEQEPNNADALHLLGVIASQVGNIETAEELIGKAINANPGVVQFHCNLARILKSNGKIEEALESFKNALALNPNLADVHLEMGLIYGELGRIVEASESYSNAARLDSNNFDAHYNLGVSLRLQGKLDEAVDSYLKAIKINPESAEVYNNLAFTLRLQDKLEEAELNCYKALNLKPNFIETHNNLGGVYLEQGRFHEALECFTKAVNLNGQFAEAHFNRAISLLLAGNFQEGWPEFEWRWVANRIVPPQFQQPLWDGSSLSGRSILLHREQGLGDTIQFIRYAKLVKDMGGTVLVKCQKPLIPLLKTCKGIDQLIADEDDLPNFDVHLPLMSTPGIFSKTMDSIPADVPYLFADAGLIEKWREELSKFTGLKVGIVWQGNPAQPRDKYRSFPLSACEPIMDINGLNLISLQIGAGSNQLDSYPGKIIDLVKLTSTSLDFNETAAITMNLDLVITADTSIAHLAGALGVKVWLALPYSPDWRWLLDREDSPWYPTMHLFRQKERGNWREVFERIGKTLKI